MFWRRKRSEADFRDEIRSHLELETDDLRQEGVAADYAAVLARRALGNAAALQEKHYEHQRWLWWDHFTQDVHYGFRSLRRNPVFAMAAIATLALGIGANTAIFSVVNAVLLKPLPYLHPERIIVLEPFGKNSGKTGTVVSAPDFHDWRRQNKSFAYMAYHTGGEGAVIFNGIGSFIQVQAVTPDFFAAFGLPPAAGRFWSENEHRAPVAVLSYGWALDHFGDASTALGKTITIGDKALQVVGVSAPGFQYPGKTELWTPAGLYSENPNRSAHNYSAIARLRDGVSLGAAQQEMRVIADRLERQYSENRFKSVVVTPLQDRLTVNSQTTLWVLLGAVFGVLLIACANVANLLLARDASRVRELGLRAALGASRSRILRQLLTESMLLTFAGALLGLGAARLILMGLLTMAPQDILGVNDVKIDRAVLLFVGCLTVLCAGLFGLAPARRAAAPDLNAAMRRSGAKGSDGGSSRTLRSSLVVVEVAVAVILVSGAGFLLRSFAALSRVDLGFSSERRLIAKISLPVNGEEEARRATLFQRDLIGEARALPGVRSAAGVRSVAFEGSKSTANYSIEGGPTYRPGEAPGAQMQVVTPGYFATMGIALVRGRDFSDADAWARPQVALINETFAREAFGAESPLGRRVRCGMSRQAMNGMEIVGIVKDSRQTTPGEPPRPEMFLPYLQHPFLGSRLSLVVHTNLEPYAFATALRETAARLRPEMPIRFSTMDEVLHKSLAYPRFRGVLIGCFAVLAVLLAVVGIYGVISYLVGQRTSEIGLRFALGARPVDVFRFIVGGSMRLVAIGLAIGVTGTIALSRFLRTLLFGISPYDPMTLAAVLTILATAAFLGSAIPALRASRLDPVSALRHE